MKKEVEVEERLCDIKDQLDTLMIEKETKTVIEKSASAFFL
jgi:hypothetical protein